MARLPVSSALRHHPFAKGLSEPHLARLASLVENVEFDEDEIVFRAGDPSQRFYLILSGNLCIEIRAVVYAICIQALGAGDAFGWSSLLGDREHQTVFQVRSRERSAALAIDGRRLLAACEEDSRFGMEIFRRALKMVAGRVKAVESKFAEFYGIDSPVKTNRLSGCVTSRSHQ